MRFINTPTKKQIKNLIKKLKEKQELRKCFYLEDDILLMSLLERITNKQIGLAEYLIKNEKWKNLQDLLCSFGVLSASEVEKIAEDTRESDIKNINN